MLLSMGWALEHIGDNRYRAFNAITGAVSWGGPNTAVYDAFSLIGPICLINRTTAITFVSNGNNASRVAVGVVINVRRKRE
jgi:hypothetical protein